MIDKIICFIVGHDWKYNFMSISNKSICSRCKAKEKLNLDTLQWKSVDFFEGEKRSDDELCRKWHE